MRQDLQIRKIGNAPFHGFKVNFILWMDDAISKQFIYYYLDWGTGAYAKIYFVRVRSQGDI